MKIAELTLRSFRNVEESAFTPHGRLNFLVGANGQGKTSVLEAIGYLATLRSFRGARSDEVVRWDSPGAEILCRLEDDEEGAPFATELKIVFAIDAATQRSSKVAFVNGKPFRSSAAYLSQRFGSYELGFHTVVFNPSDHDLVRGEPSIRRQYLDRVLAAEDVEYLKTFQKYQRVLEQRNALLKGDEPPSRALLAGFTEPLGRYGAWIASKRLQWLDRLAERLSDTARRIAPTQELLRAFYVSNWVPEIRHLSIPNKDLNSGHFSGQQHRPSLEELEQSFWSKLSVLEETELRTRSSLVGPHRDDWAFFFGSQPLKGHGSQGEVRSALLALKLCEIELFRSRTGHRPLLLLDDFSSELDRERRSFLLRYLSETDLQVFVTTTDEALSVGRRYRVSGGAVSEDKAGHDDPIDSQHRLFR
jgi:DNA replication and repair protein RecF